MNMEQRQRIQQSIEKRHILLAWATRYGEELEAARIKGEIAALEKMMA